MQGKLIGQGTFRDLFDSKNGKLKTYIKDKEIGLVEEKEVIINDCTEKSVENFDEVRM